MASLTVRERIQLSTLDFLSKRGIYAGRRFARIHVALYRRSRGKLGSRLPGWRNVRMLLIDHVGAKSSVRARLASDEERDHLWPKLVASFPAYDMYQRNAKNRRIPVVVLDARQPGDA